MAEILMQAGRVAIGLFFVIACWRNVSNFAHFKQHKTIFDKPLPVLVLWLGFALQAITGVALILGVYVPWASAALILFLLIATPLYHFPFAFPKEDRGLHIYLCLVNAMMVGMLLQLIGGAL